MNRRYEVELTGGALDDLRRLTADLLDRWPEGAERLTARFHEALRRLEEFPHSCSLAYESRWFPEPIRHLLFETRKGRTYRALFIVDGGRVRVLAVRAPGQKPLDEKDLRSRKVQGDPGGEN